MKVLNGILAGCLVMVMCSSMAFAGGVTLVGEAEINGKVDSSSVGDVDEMTNHMSGYVKLILKGQAETESGWIMDAQGDLILNNESSSAPSAIWLDDSWMRFRKGSFSLKLGKFEAEYLFPKGNDVYVAWAPGSPGRYEGSYARGRGTLGNFALSSSLSEKVWMEVAGVYGNTTAYGVGLDGANVAVNQYGLRPVVKLTAGPLTLKGGVDFLTQMPKNSDADGNTTKLGFALNSELRIGKFALGLVGTSGTEGGESYVDGSDLEDVTTTSTNTYLQYFMDKGEFSTSVGYWIEDANDSNAMYWYGAYTRYLPFNANSTKLSVGLTYANVRDLVDAEDSDVYGVMVKLWTGFGGIQSGPGAPGTGGL